MQTAEQRRKGRNAYARKYRAKHKEELAAAKRLYYEANKDFLVEKSRDFRADPKNAEYLKNLSAAGFLRRKYGITLQARAQMLEEQGGVCAICGNPETAITKEKDKAKGLSIDHNHTTGKIRGLLCHKCNMGLGLFMEDIDLLASATSYLINHTEIKLVV